MTNPNPQPAQPEASGSPSPQTIKALKEAVKLYRKDVEMSLGLDSV